MHILIADDDPVSRELQVCLLQQWGHEAIPTRNGAEAWTALQSNNPPPLAILDRLMPQPRSNIFT
jgi:CheY-like chemotaxis protein